jgi:hypothetical protein
MTVTCTATLAKITKVEFRRHHDGMLLSAGEGEWEAKVTRADGTTEIVYREFIPAPTNERMTRSLYYADHNGRTGTFTWKIK